MSHNFNPQAGHAVGATVTLAIVCSCVAVILRVIARRISNAQFWWDDWLIACAALPLEVGCNVALILERPAPMPGGGMAYRKNLYAQGIAFNSCLFFVKISVLLTYWRLFKIKKGFRISVYIVAAMVTISCVSALAVNIFHCSPVQKAWNDEIQGSCLPPLAFLLGQGIPDAVTDLIIVILPMPHIWVLKTSFKERAAICALLLLGSLTMHTSIGRMVSVGIQVKSENITTSFPLIILSALEPAVAIISASLICLGPLFRLRATRLRNKRDSPHYPHGRPVDSHERPKAGDSLDDLRDNRHDSKISDEVTVVSYDKPGKPELTVEIEPAFEMSIREL